MNGPLRIRTDVPYQLCYREEVFSDTEEKRLPMVVVLHGTGSNEKDFLKFLHEKEVTAPIRIISLRGPLRYSLGYRWVYGKGEDAKEAQEKHDIMLQEVCTSIAGSIDELMKKYPTVGRPYVLGFSRGAMLAYYLGVNHPEKFEGVFAISGQLSPKFIPKKRKKMLPPIHGYHGVNDDLVSIGGGRRTVADIKKISGKVYFKEHREGHTVPKDVLDDILRNIKKYTARY